LIQDKPPRKARPKTELCQTPECGFKQLRTWGVMMLTLGWLTVVCGVFAMLWADGVILF
jgi:hypothetical protein